MLDGGLGSQRAVTDGDFAELDWGVGRLEDVLRDVRLQSRTAVNTPRNSGRTQSDGH